jgi:lysine-specific demethylase/histidyl-hydroxylase NO66
LLLSSQTGQGSSSNTSEMDFPFLSELTGDIDGLLAAHESRTPAHFRTGKSFADLFSIQSAEELLTRSMVVPELIGVVRTGGQVPTDSFINHLSIGVGGDPRSVVDPKKLSGFFATGYTVLIRGVDTFHSPLRSFAENLEKEISHPVSINCYISPPKAAGLSRHYDMHEVLVLQVEGSKTWEIGPRGFLDPLEGRHPHKPSGGMTEEQTVTMNPGDVLYVPRGYLHRCVSGEKSSLHLTTAIMTRSWIDILNDFLEEATDTARFRAGVPWGFLRSKETLAIDGAAEDFYLFMKENESVFEREQAVIDKVRRLSESKVLLQ